VLKYELPDVDEAYEGFQYPQALARQLNPHLQVSQEHDILVTINGPLTKKKCWFKVISCCPFDLYTLELTAQRPG
jgi:hypothetical protein